jgi:hypothetical protein
MSSKRQTTMAKLQRERRVKERRELKREKKEARRAGLLDPEAVDAEHSDEQPTETPPAAEVDP